MKKYPLLFSLVLTTLISISQNATGPSKKNLTDSCDKFMKLFQTGKPLEAIQMLKTISIIGESTIDKLSGQVESQLETIDNNYGKMVSYEFIKEQEIKDFLVKRLYLLKLEKFYLKFSFILYKTNMGWKVTSFIYNEDLADVF